MAGPWRHFVRGVSLPAALVMLSALPVASYSFSLPPARLPCAGRPAAAAAAAGGRAGEGVARLAGHAPIRTPPLPGPGLGGLASMRWGAGGLGRRGGRGGGAGVLRPLLMSSRPAEGPDVCPVPAGLDQAMEQCGAAVSSALLSGNRGMTIDVFTPDLDPMSRGFDMANMHRLCMGVADCLRKFTGDGEIKFVVQDFSKATSLVSALKESEVYGELVGEGKITVDSLLGSLSLADSKDAAAVVLVMPTNTLETKVTKEVRDLLKSCRGSITVVVNQAMDTLGPNGQPLGTLPMEIDNLERVFYLEPFSLQASPQGGAPPPPASPDAVAEDGDVGTGGGEGADSTSAEPVQSGPAPLRIAVTRATPGEWGVWAFQDEDQRYELQKAFRAKPSRRVLLEVCQAIIKSRTS